MPTTVPTAQPTVRWLRAVVVLAPLLALFAGSFQGLVPPMWSAVLTAALALWSAWRPEHLLSAGPLLTVGGWWAYAAGSDVPPTALLAAAALVAGHVAGLVLGYGPPHLAVERAVLVLWLRRAALVWLVAPVLWLVGQAYAGHSTPELLWLVGLATTAGGAFLAATALGGERRT